MADVEIFELDGVKVACGNNKPDSLPNLYAPVPEHMLWTDKQIKAALEEPVKQVRKKRRKWMINQSSVGKCNCSAARAGVYQIRELMGQDHVPLSDNYLYWNINDGKDQGSLLHHAMGFLRANGMSPLTLNDGTRDVGRIPIDAFRGNEISREMLKMANEQAKRFIIHEPFQIPKDWEGFRRTVATCLARGWPVIMAWAVNNKSMRLDGKGYCQSGLGSRDYGNHASLFHYAKFVGGNDIVHPDLQNSWGPTASELYGPKSPGWGDRGFGFMTMEQAYHCRQWHDFYTITSVIQDPWYSLVA